MSSLARMQAELCAALSPFRSARQLRKGKALVRPYGTLDGAGRLGIYQHNISGAHIAVLESVFPVCREVLGMRVFATLACDYTWNYPAIDADLNRYGAEFPALLREHAGSLSALPYLQDLARLEYYWHQALFAAHEPPFDFTGFAVAAQWPDRLRFRTAQSLYLLRSDWPVLEIWRRHRDGEAPAEIEADAAPDRLVVARIAPDVTVNRLDADEFSLLEAVCAGRSLTQLTIEPCSREAVHRLPGLIERGWITGFATGRQGRPCVQ